YGDGEQRRDFVHVSDIVAANLLAMDSRLSWGIYNIGTGKATSVNEVARLLCDRIAPGLHPGHVAAHAGELRNSIPAIGRARADLGFEPRATLAGTIDAVSGACRAAAGPPGMPA